MELRYRREALVGVLLIAATVAFVALLLWLKGQPIRTGPLLRASFADVAGLKVGDPVRTSGVRVGSVRKVELEAPGRVVVSIDVHRTGMPMADASVAIRSLDFFGARYVEYSPGRSDRPLAEDSVIRGDRESDISEVGTNLANQGREFLANATELLGPATTNELRATMRQTQRTLQTLARAADAPSQELVRSLADLRRIAQRLDILLERTGDPAAATVQNMQRLTADMTTATATLSHAATTLDTLLSRINSGRGAAGQLVNDTTLMLEIRRTNTALQELLVDFRANPGRYIRLRF